MDRLKEILGAPPGGRRDSALVVGHGREDREAWVQVLAEVHDGGDVAAAVAVVGSAPYCDDGFIFEVPLCCGIWSARGVCDVQWVSGEIHLVALVDQLVSTRNELEAIDMVELRCDLISKQPPCTTRRDSPGANVLWVAPDEIAKGAFVGDLLSASNDTDLVNGADFRTEPTVDAENFAVNDGAEDEEVEDLATGFPDGGVAVFLLAFFVETVYLGDLARLVVAADDGDAVGVATRRVNCCRVKIVTGELTGP